MGSMSRPFPGLDGSQKQQIAFFTLSLGKDRTSCRKPALSLLRALCAAVLEDPRLARQRFETLL